jgi:uncharacterized protein (DUF433 family)
MAIDAARQALEAERMARVPGIYFMDEYRDRPAKVEGTGLGVWEIINQLRWVPHDFEAQCAVFEWLEPKQIRAALDYYAMYPDEIHAAIAENDAVLDDLEKNGPYVFSDGAAIRYPRKNGRTPSG